jgi:lambda repressor-like predicted transcriptional regulator
MGKSGPTLDIISYFPENDWGVFEEIAPLYEKGLSISDIADQTGLKNTAIWRNLKKQRKVLRSQDPVSFDRWRKGRGKTRARPPYGFCYFQGEVIKSPNEYPTLLLIESLSRKHGLSITAIVDALAKKKIKSRTGKGWSYNVIKSTLKRFEDGTIARLMKATEVIKRSKK